MMMPFFYVAKPQPTAVRKAMKNLLEKSKRRHVSDVKLLSQRKLMEKVLSDCSSLALSFNLLTVNLFRNITV
jgi:hypothetical protein